MGDFKRTGNLLNFKSFNLWLLQYHPELISYLDILHKEMPWLYDSFNRSKDLRETDYKQILQLMMKLNKQGKYVSS